MLKFIQLPPHISGFTSAYHKAIPCVSLRKIENFIQDLPFEFKKFTNNNKSKNYNYHYLSAKNKEEKFLIFFNKLYPIIAVSKILESNQASYSDLPKNEFVDVPSLESYAKQHQFILLRKELLEQKMDADIPVVQSIVGQLSQVEFAEFSYYEPQVIADIIFNNWDKN